MPRLVALQLGVADGLLAALDEVWARGDVPLPVDPGLPAAATGALLAAARPAVHRTPDGTVRDDDAPPLPHGAGLVVATSGSTGTPRPVVLSHDALDAMVTSSRARLGADDGVPWLGVLPLHHVAGITVVLRSRAAGREPLLHPRDTVEVVDGSPPSWLSLVPLQLRRLLDAGARLDRHHGVLLGGAAAPTELLDRARDVGVHVVTSYGSTETCGGVVYDGLALDGTRLRTVDGVLEVRGPTLADGVRRPDGTVVPLVDEDGWLRTSDRGEVRPDGRVVVHGRADLVAVSGGENVPLRPVREAVAALPGVAESAVVALPDERWGEAVVAVVVPAGDPPTLPALRAALAGALPPTHRPTRLLVVDALPTDAMGKVTPRTVAAALAPDAGV